MKANTYEIGRTLKDFDEIEVAEHEHPKGATLETLYNCFSEFSEDELGEILCMIAKGR